MVSFAWFWVSFLVFPVKILNSVRLVSLGFSLPFEFLLWVFNPLIVISFFCLVFDCNRTFNCGI